MHSVTMRPIATGVARSVVCESVCVGHTSEPCKNVQTDQNAAWGQTRVGQRNRVDGVNIDATWGIRLNDPCYPMSNEIDRLWKSRILSH